MSNFEGLMQGLEEEKLHRTLIPSSVTSFFDEGMQKQVKQIVKNDETGAHESWGGATYIDHFMEKDKVAVGVAGNEVMASSAQEILQDQATKIDQVRISPICPLPPTGDPKALPRVHLVSFMVQSEFSFIVTIVVSMSLIS
ncbi:hypothetical protein Acr_14g0008110 [Actinidia rufa]|uniref:Uncharacterized protein n=1 Tax=Actinidia rufa TaxID=165716 RepID=A0A7J0FR43_9ERIC|nr:hypothetical protein Acr_14g0008110 [Actinidia rufa]